MTEGEEDEERATVELLCADLALAQRLVAVLGKVEVPAFAHARTDGRAVLAVPSSRGRMATAVLGDIPGLVVDDGVEPFYRLHDPAKDRQLFDHAVLRETPQQLRARGEEALKDLVECVLRGVGTTRDRAIVALAKLGPDGAPAVDALIVRLTAAGAAPLLGALMRATVPAEGRGGAMPASLAELRSLARHEDAAVRQLAIRALGALRYADTVQLIAGALVDESPDVAIEADDAFLEWGADDVGFDPEMTPEKKAEIAMQRGHFKPD